MTSITGFGYGNLTDAATLSGSGWSVTHPLTELQSRDLAEYAETTGTTAEIVFDHGSAKAAAVFGLIAHTVTDASATIRVTRGTTSGAADVLDSGALTAWPFAPLDGDRDGSVFGLWVIEQETTARYTKIAVSGSAVMRFGRAFVGRIFLPTWSPPQGRTSDGWIESMSTVDRMANGTDRVWQRRQLRTAAWDSEFMSPAEASLLTEIMRTHGTTGEVVYVRDRIDRAAQQQRGFLGLLRKLGALEYPHWRFNSAPIAIDERGGAP